MSALKEHISRQSIHRLGEVLALGDGDFPIGAFVEQAARGLDDLELKARIAQVASALKTFLPNDFRSAASLVHRTVPGSTLTMWEAWPVMDWVAEAGIQTPEPALELISAVTPKASGEFAIRPFIDRHPDLVFETMGRWVEDPDEEVRRLVSEGSRPRLPWAPRIALLEDEPGWAIPLLDALRDDPSAYVRRSVANHLNDLSKVDAALAIDIAQRWTSEGGAPSHAVVRHGLRTLIKAGDARALTLLGVDMDAPIAAEHFEVTPKTIHLGEEVTWRCRLRSSSDRSVTAVIDYVVHLRGARGTPRRKVFKFKTLRLDPGEAIELVRRHRFLPVTTRRYYAGSHRIDLQVNGKVLGSGHFDLLLR